MITALVHTSPVSPNLGIKRTDYTVENASGRNRHGVNDWSCKPTAKHPRPVVLVHGLILNKDLTWLYMGPRFAREGYCVFSLTYGQVPELPLVAGLDKLENGAQQLSVFVDKVLAATGAKKLDLVGHSAGTLMPRYYLRFLGGASKVQKFAGFGALVHGTSLHSLVPLTIALGLYDPVTHLTNVLCRACSQFLSGSPFLTKLNAGHDTVPGVDYHFIVTETDEIVTPFVNGFLKDKNPRVENVVLQDLCPLDVLEHMLLILDPIVFHSINGFLTPTAKREISCLDLLH
ncbi:MAG: secreted lipase [Podila humilis]|nr:MAG: secreted lipase [Podila humilis]